MCYSRAVLFSLLLLWDRCHMPKRAGRIQQDHHRVAEMRDLIDHLSVQAGLGEAAGTGDEDVDTRCEAPRLDLESPTDGVGLHLYLVGHELDGAEEVNVGGVKVETPEKNLKEVDTKHLETMKLNRKTNPL